MVWEGADLREEQAARNGTINGNRVRHKRKGYKEVGYNIIDTENGDCLCYDVMRLEKAYGQRG